MHSKVLAKSAGHTRALLRSAAVGPRHIGSGSGATTKFMYTGPAWPNTASRNKTQSMSQGGPSAQAVSAHFSKTDMTPRRHCVMRCNAEAACSKAVRSSTAAGLAVMQNHTHIVPVFVGDPERCKRASDLLLERHAIYIQSINYPTVAKGTERLRITPSPHHDNTLINELAEALADVWGARGLPLNRPALPAN